jgi:translation elongation factor EF-Tu-like GTPase
VVFVAQVVFLDPSDGGRASLAGQGYRPTIRFAGSELLLAGRVNFLQANGEPLAKGARAPREVEAEIWLFNEDVATISMEIGTTFELTEGTYAVAKGRIVRSIRSTDFDFKFAGEQPWRLAE